MIFFFKIYFTINQTNNQNIQCQPFCHHPIWKKKEITKIFIIFIDTKPGCLVWYGLLLWTYFFTSVCRNKTYNNNSYYGFYFCSFVWRLVKLDKKPKKRHFAATHISTFVWRKFFTCVCHTQDRCEVFFTWVWHLPEKSEAFSAPLSGTC